MANLEFVLLATSNLREQACQETATKWSTSAAQSPTSTSLSRFTSGKRETRSFDTHATWKPFSDDIFILNYQGCDVSSRVSCRIKRTNLIWICIWFRDTKFAIFPYWHCILVWVRTKRTNLLPTLVLYLVRRSKICQFPLLALYLGIGQN